MLGNSLVSSDPDLLTSSKSPLEFKIRWPRGFKNSDLGCVGLGIVAALEKSGGVRREIPAKFIVGSLNLNRSDPIPVGSAKTKTKFRGGLEGSEMGCWENYTSVNPHGPSKSSFTRGYCNGGEDSNAGSGFDRRCRNLGVFSESPPPRYAEAFPAYPTLDFLSSCHLCRKKLHGKDIYMYRGEKAFCSSECRNRQIVIDEGNEKCGSEALKSADISPYSGRPLFSTGITAA